jgi:hypothetical protein
MGSTSTPADGHVNNSLFDILDEVSAKALGIVRFRSIATLCLFGASALIALQYPLIEFGIWICCLMVYFEARTVGSPGADRTTVTRACPEAHGTRSALHPRRFDLPTDRSSGTRRDLGHRPDRYRLPGSGSTAATTQHPHASPSSAVITDLPSGRIKISDIGNRGAQTGGVSRHARFVDSEFVPDIE